MAVDESICRFQGRSYKTTCIPKKPIPIGYKVWVIAQIGYFFQWIQHENGRAKGPVRVKTPQELGGSKNGKGGNKTAALVPHLLSKLPPCKYIVYLDNLFVS